MRLEKTLNRSMIKRNRSSLLSNTRDTDNMCQPKGESTIHFQLFNVEKTDRIPI